MPTTGNEACRNTRVLDPAKLVESPGLRCLSRLIRGNTNEHSRRPIVWDLTTQPMDRRMKTLIVSAFITCLAELVPAQGPVLIGGGSTHPQPVMGGHSSPRVVVTKVVFRQTVNPLNPYATASLNIGTEAPLVSEVAVATYSPWRPNCNDTYRFTRSHYSTPSVVYFGRGESCQRGYAFRNHR